MRLITQAVIGLLVIAGMVLGCADKDRPHAFHYAKVEQRFAPGARPTTAPAVILVGDFDLGAAAVKSDPGLVNKLSEARPRLFGSHLSSDPATRLHELGEMLADDLVKDLKSKGINAQRQVVGEKPPASAWLVSGAFLSVDEGNRRRRAILGFGTGASDAKLEVALSDLASGDGKPFEEMSVESRSGQMPGAVVTLNPGVAAASYVLNGDASEKDIKKAAENIASDLHQFVEDVKSGKPPSDS